MLRSTTVQRAAALGGRRCAVPRTLMVTRFAPDKAAQAKPIDQLIVEDHNKVRQLNLKFRQSRDQDEREKLAYLIIRELSMHSAKEEEVLYPAVAKVFGQQESDNLLKSHTVLKERLADLSAMDPHKDGGAAFDAQMALVMEEFNHHSQDEERRELPAFLSASGVDGVALGRQFAEAGEHAVTRPHTWAPDKGPLNWFTNRATAPLDTLADLLRFGGPAPKVEPPPPGAPGTSSSVPPSPGTPHMTPPPTSQGGGAPPPA